ncbi:hypothetical protein H0A58_12790 [Alcaligenaceae bacterium]|nr:hypothetical protein [Alcaligenaceae bacterium]
MTDDVPITFAQFASQYRGKFRQIAGATRREIEMDDVEGEAWLMTKEWELQGIPIRFNDASYIDKLFAYLYQKLVKYADKKVRFGVRLDHWDYGNNQEADTHPLLNKLAAAENSQPLEALLAQEASAEHLLEPEPHETRASAYLYLLRLYNNCMKDVANHLMISLSYCYYRFNEALEMVSKQQSFPDTAGRPVSSFVPGPWRSFRLRRPWVQMELDLLSADDLWEEPDTDF